MPMLLVVLKIVNRATCNPVHFARYRTIPQAAVHANRTCLDLCGLLRAFVATACSTPYTSTRSRIRTFADLRIRSTDTCSVRVCPPGFAVRRGAT